jgi:hypothetical protein
MMGPEQVRGVYSIMPTPAKEGADRWDASDTVDLDDALLQLAGVRDVPGAQNWSPPSRAPSASAFTRP